MLLRHDSLASKSYLLNFVGLHQRHSLRALQIPRRGIRGRCSRLAGENYRVCRLWPPSTEIVEPVR